MSLHTLHDYTVISHMQLYNCFPHDKGVGKPVGNLVFSVFYVALVLLQFCLVGCCCFVPQFVMEFYTIFL